MKNPIIFLNINGVLISEKFISDNSGFPDKLYYKLDDNYYMNFEPDKIDLIKKLIKESNAHIVIVSYWCEHNDLDKFKKIFKRYDLDDRIVDIIPFVPKKKGYKINDWINTKSNNFPHLNNEKFVIIDNDDTGILENKHIKCNPKCGLTEENISQSIKILKK